MIMELKDPEEVISKMSACPIGSSFKILGQKFMILILRDLVFFGEKGFSSLLESVEGINQKTPRRLKEPVVV